jgi:invasion protein IalB
MIARRFSRCVLPVLAAGAAFLASASAALAQGAVAQTAVETGRFGDWIVHQSSGGGSKICFAATQPKTKEPATANRSKIVLYISAWPKEGVKSEISIKMGYPVKSGSTVAVTVGSDVFDLFGKDDRAFVADPTEELKLIEAMKKGSKLTVQGSSEKGTVTIDTYSLNGLGQAMQALAAACP